MRVSSRIFAAVLVVVLVVPLAGPAAGQQPPDSTAPSDATMTSMPPVPPETTQAPPLPKPVSPDATAQAPPPPMPVPSDTTVQAPPSPPPPPAGAPPPPPPGPIRMQPDLFQETLKASRSREEDQAAYNAGAAVVNVFLVPGRAITCALGGVVGVGVLLLTLGSGYRAAAAAGREGCGGKWLVTGDDLRPRPYTSDAYEWERR